MHLANHELLPDVKFRSIRYEERPLAEGLHAAWIWLDNEKQLNSYTTDALKELILAFRKASADRRCVNVVLTGAGERAFCTGGNTAEYATLYAGRPTEYAQYMRLFNDTVTSILLCDKPVVCRVNGMRIGGGQEIGMACDFSIAGDHATFGQAGPVHGSAPDGGSTDFLDLYVGYAFAAESLVLCEPWSALRAYQRGLLNEVVPVYRDVEGNFIANPSVDSATGEMRRDKKRIEGLRVDFSRLDEAIERISQKLLRTFPDCTRKTLESLRKKKLEHWFRNSETNRSWLALNMNTEAAAGFAAFHFGEKPHREIDFALLRRRIAEGARFDEKLIREVLPESARKAWDEWRDAR